MRALFPALVRPRELRARGAADRVDPGQRVGLARGVVRGLHFQRPPHAEAKHVRAVHGTCSTCSWTCAGSATYARGTRSSFRRSAATWCSSPGFRARLLRRERHGGRESYLVDNAYAPQSEGGLAWDDPALAIPGPCRGAGHPPERDRAWPRLAELEPLVERGGGDRRGERPHRPGDRVPAGGCRAAHLAHRQGSGRRRRRRPGPARRGAARCPSRCDALVHAAGGDRRGFRRCAARLGEGARGRRGPARHGARRGRAAHRLRLHGPRVRAPAGRDRRGHAPAARIGLRARPSSRPRALSRGSGGGPAAARAPLRGVRHAPVPRALSRAGRSSVRLFRGQALGGRIVLRFGGPAAAQFRRRRGRRGPGRAMARCGRRGDHGVANAPGPWEMSVYDFALQCARVAAEETGERCEVVRPERTAPPASLSNTARGSPAPCRAPR